MPFNIALHISSKEKLYKFISLAIGVLAYVFIISLYLLILNFTPATEEGLKIKNAVNGFTFLVFVYIGLAIIIAMISVRIIKAKMFGNYVLVNEQQFPHIYEIVKDSSKRLGLKTVPEVFIYNSQGIMNAFAMRLTGSKKYICLTSAIIDADNDKQIRFVIGHELGHHVAGHLNTWFRILAFPNLFIPFLPFALSRAREITCDRIGHYVADDIHDSASALQMLACGSAKLNHLMNHEAFHQQEKMVSPLWGFYHELFLTHPRLTLRVAELKKWAQRNPN